MLLQALRTTCLVVVISLVASYVSAQTPTDDGSHKKPPEGTIQANKSQAIKEVRCRNPQDNKVCRFLAANYDEVRARCGITASRRLKSKLLFWSRPYQPIDSVPNNVFYGIDAKTFEDNGWLGDDPGTTSLGRMLSVAFFADTEDKCKAGDQFIKELHSAGSSDAMLQFDPLLAPDLSLVAGESRVVDTMTCSGVTEALQSANFAISSAGANNKITVRNNSNVRYKLVYGMFRSPMSYMEDSARTTYFLEAAEWYIRHPMPSGSIPGTACFASSLRGLAVYDEFGNQSEIASAIRGGGQFANLLFSVQASASNQQSTETSNSSLSFRNLIHNDMEFKPLPSWRDIVKYLSGDKIGFWLKDAKFDPDTKRVTTTIAIDGVMPGMCPTTNQPGIAWTILAYPQRDCVALGGPDPEFRIDKIEFVAAGNEVIVGPVGATVLPTATSKCKFTLSAPLTGDHGQVQASFKGSLSPSAPQPKDCSIAIPIDAVQRFENATLRLLGKSSNESIPGVWYQVQDPAKVLDLARSPRNDGTVSNCVDAVVMVESKFPTKTSSIDGNYMRVTGTSCDNPSGDVTFYLQGTAEETVALELPTS